MEVRFVFGLILVVVVVASALPWPQDGVDAAQAEGDEKNVDARHHNRHYYSNYYYPSYGYSNYGSGYGYPYNNYYGYNNGYGYNNYGYLGWREGVAKSGGETEVARPDGPSSAVPVNKGNPDSDKIAF